MKFKLKLSIPRVKITTIILILIALAAGFKCGDIYGNLSTNADIKTLQDAGFMQVGNNCKPVLPAFIDARL